MQSSIELDYKGITPKSHPLAVDIFSGDGSMAFLLNQKGWDARNITCIDIARSTRPLVEGVHWLYWNLDALTAALKHGNLLPPEIEMQRGRFDLAMSMLSIRSDSGFTVCEFLIKPDGIAITDE